MSLLDFLISVLEPESNELPAALMQEWFNRAKPNEWHVYNIRKQTMLEPETSHDELELMQQDVG
ncbi:hypothetical protein [Fulvimarina sp. MAC8]|uniref:hypothetical protein n=1 Tax=Fulvimarina sp. MAC8 TaxID=3162874 RepID=UPI0032EF4696